MKKIIVLLALVLTGNAASAQLIRSSALIVTEEELPPVELGWKHIVDGQIGGVNDIFQLAIHYIAGYRFSKNLLAGVGTGYEHLDTSMVYAPIHRDFDEEEVLHSPDGAVPLYIHSRYYFSTKKWAPYVGASVGLYLASQTDVKRPVYEPLSNGDYRYVGMGTIATYSSISAYADFNIGFNHRLNAKNELSLYAGVKYWGQQRYELANASYEEYEKFHSSKPWNGTFRKVDGGDFWAYFGTSITF